MSSKKDPFTQERQYLAIKHSSAGALQALESMVQELGFTSITARSYPAFIDLYKLNDRKVVAVLYQLEPRGEQYPQQHRLISPQEIITSIQRRNSHVPFIALYTSGPQTPPADTLLNFGVNAVLQYPITKILLEEKLNNLGIKKQER